TPRGRRHFARALSLLLARHGPLDPATRDRVIDFLEDRYPTGEFSTDRHLVEILVALQAPGVPEATMPLIEQAGNQEEAIHYLHVLRLQEDGWSPELTDRAIAALLRAQAYAGGASLKGFVDVATKGVLGQLGPEAVERFMDALASAKASPAEGVDRPFVRSWTLEEFDVHLPRVYASRNFERGRGLYESLQCAACHKFGDLGVAYGPDLSSVGNRFSPRDLLISMLEPKRDLSDQYAAVEATLDDGEVVVGLPAREDADILVLVPDPRTGRLGIEVQKSRIVDRGETTTMPASLLDTCTMDEVLDLLAYMVTAGDSSDPAFRPPP
ncbi:MAG: c-type cytochrome, partial [Phycisphaerales bacterium]|nr:c-type cytochrome [Phycisphaerales bacterium]